MSSAKDPIDQIPESPQIPANVIALPPYAKRMVAEEVAKQFEEVEKELARLKASAGGNMSDSTISKDWVERKTSELESKIEIDRVKSDARFERLISDSDIKFEKLVGEMNTKFAMSESRIIQVESAHTKWMVGLVFSFIAFTLGAVGFSTTLILRAIPSFASAEKARALSEHPVEEIIEKSRPIPQEKTLHPSEKPKT